MKYTGTCYPNWESQNVEVEAENKEDAKEEMEKIANINCSFGIDLKDVVQEDKTED